MTVGKDEILADLQVALQTGLISESDVRAVLSSGAPVKPEIVEVKNDDVDKPDKLSAVDVMFYIAGIVLFAALMSTIVQSWEDGSAVTHIALSAVVGLIMWSIAYYLITNPVTNDIRKGLTNSLLLTGSLSVIVGGYIITNEIIGGFDELNLIPGAFTLLVLGGLHISFDRLIKKDLILLLGVLLAVAAFPTLLFGLLQNARIPDDVWSVIVLATGGLLVCATRVIAKVNPERTKLAKSFDAFAAFVALGTMYVSSFGDSSILWLLMLIASVFGIFYLSIIAQNKQLLGNGSFFLVLTVVTIAFRYFSGYGVTFSLILATCGLLGSAAIAASINRKYFKPATKSK